MMGQVREGLDLLEEGWAAADEDGLTFVAFLGAFFSGSDQRSRRSTREKPSAGCRES